MPCFNHGRFLSESVHSILNQTERDFELIIVDDSSTDDSWDRIQTLSEADRRIKPIRNSVNSGASKSRNVGIQAGLGEFLGFCDADDVWENEKLASQIELLRTNDRFDVAYCDALIIDENGAATGKRFSNAYPPPGNPSGDILHELLKRNFVNMQSVLLRRESLAGLRFDPEIKWVEDWWFWIQLSRRAAFLYSKECFARYRVHSLSTNRVQRRGYSVNRIKVLIKAFRLLGDQLPNCLKAHILYAMAAEMGSLGKRREAKRVLSHSALTGICDVRSLPLGMKAFGRLLFGFRARKNTMQR
jgi:teichuronic acid biosynthesis glycosyltransferase TuaG